MPHTYDPSDATDYLNADDGDDDIPDTETLIVLRELQTVFPMWAITYSCQMRSWIARTGDKTICKSSPYCWPWR